MPTLNPHNRELSFKLVFYGPGLGGKTTTLKTLFASTKPENRGKMVSVATQQDRTLHFDFLPLRVPRVRGMTVRLQLYTVPGQLYYGATRRLLLSGVDGVVFVADSQEGRLEPNQEALDDLRQNLAELNRPLEELPHTFHWNKRDLSDLVPIEELERRFNAHGAPSLGTVATTGEGVFEGLERITRLVLRAHEGEELDTRPLLGIMEDPGGIAQVLKSMVEATPQDDAVKTKDAPAHSVSFSEATTEGAPVEHGGGLGARLVEAHRTRDPMEGAVPSDDFVPIESLGIRLPEEQPLADDPLEDGDEMEPSVPTSDPSRTSGSGAVPKVRFGTAEVSTALSVQRPEGIPPLGERIPRIETVSELPPVPSPPVLPSDSPVFSFRHHFAQAERRAVELAESHLARKDAKAAVLACDVAMSRLLAGVGASLGSQSAPKDPATVAYLLGLEGPRYLVFRSLVRAARHDEPVSLSAAFEAFVFLLDANRRREALRTPR